MSGRYCISRKQVESALTVLAAAGRRLVKAQPNVRWRLKADGTFLTELDGKIQRFLKQPLSKIFPGCVFVGEEDAQSIKGVHAPSPRLILDPIDGSGAYARGFNCFSISLGLIDSNGEPVLGIVHIPSQKKWYAGAFEAGGWVSYTVSVASGRAKVRRRSPMLSNRPATKLKDSYIYVSSDAHRQLEMSAFNGKIRALGPSASHLALLLDRTPDPVGVILTQYKLWDVVAGLALAEAAGFEIRDLRRPKEVLGFPDFINELLNSKQSPPLIIGPKNIVNTMVRTIKSRKEHP